MSAPEPDYVSRMFAAISQRDMAAFKACFCPEAIIWHCDDEIERDVDAICTVIESLLAASVDDTVAYTEQRIVRAGKQYFVQHVLVADLHSGERLRVPAMMRIDTDDHGRVMRIDEYYDSRDVDCLA